MRSIVTLATGIVPVVGFHRQVADALDSRVNVDEAFAIFVRKRCAAAHRAWDMLAQLVIDFSACVIGGQVGTHWLVFMSGRFEVIQCDDGVIGGNQHRHDAEITEFPAAVHTQGYTLAGAKQPFG